MNGHLEKPFRIHICRDGTLTVCGPGEKPFNGVALPVYTTDTEDQAKQLIVLMGTVQYNEHPLLKNQPWYRLAGFDGEVESLPAVAEMFASAEKILQEDRMKTVLLHWRVAKRLAHLPWK